MNDPAQTSPIDQQDKLPSQAFQGPTLAPSSAQPLTINHQPSIISGHPEINPGIEPVIEQKADIEVIPESPEISPELAEHVEKVVRGEIQLPGEIKVGKHEGEEVTISPFTPQQPNIVLPLSQSDFQLGTKQPTSSAWKWLVEWIKRIILKNPGRAVYRT